MKEILMTSSILILSLLALRKLFKNKLSCSGKAPLIESPPLSLSEDKIAHDHCYQLKRIRIICKSFGEQNIYLSLSKYHILRSFPEFAIISIELKLTTVNA